MAKELAKQYDPKGTEDRIYQEWCDKGYFHTQIDRSKKPFNHRNAAAECYRPAAHGPRHGRNLVRIS